MFINDGLVSILVLFVGKVDARIAALRDNVAPSSSISNENPVELPAQLLDGICTDLVNEIQMTRDHAMVTERGLSSEAISEFVYLLAAVVDEMLIATLSNQFPRHFNGAVEYMIFGTRDAGEQVFIRIERLLARRSQLDLGLAAAYLLTLSLGFKGQYFQQENSETLNRYHRELSSLALRFDAVSDRQIAVEAVDKSGVSAIVLRNWLSFLWCVIGMTWFGAAIAMEIFWRSETALVRQSAAELHTSPSPAPLRVNEHE